jgi:transcriptional regulator with XRE-family HTH domain
VNGLRREEVALLAGISVEYYTQLERGSVRGVSEDVLEAVARALRLDEVERGHLFDLVRAVKRRPTRPRRTPEQVRPGVQRVLDTITESAAFVRNERLDILSANRLGYALYSDVFANPERPANLARFIFLDAQSRRFYRDWNGIADAAVGNLRAKAGRDPYDRDLTDLVGQLSMQSEDFRVRWASHDVRQYRSGTQPFHHSLVGDLTLNYEAFQVTADVDLILIVYTAEPDSPSQAALSSLANWAGDPDQAQR